MCSHICFDFQKVSKINCVVHDHLNYSKGLTEKLLKRVEKQNQTLDEQEQVLQKQAKEIVNVRAAAGRSTMRIISPGVFKTHW